MPASFCHAGPMPTGEQAPEGFVAQVVEYLADVYTEAVKPMFFIVFTLLTVLVLVRLGMRLRQHRRGEIRPATPRAGPAPPG